MFTSDWVHYHTKNWEAHLSQFKSLPCAALEIGSHEGRSAIWFCQNILTHPQSTLHCIDPWKMGTLENFRANISEAKCAKKIKIISLPSQTISIGHNRYDFIYVDGEHTQFAVLSDCVKAWEALKPHGVLIIDDFLWPPVPNSHTPLKRPIEAFVAAVVPRLGTMLHKGFQVMLKKL